MGFLKVITFFTFQIFFNSVLTQNALKFSAQWSTFKGLFRKKYNNPLEEALRFKIYNSNMDYIEKHNALADLGKMTFRLRMNQYGDLTLKEFRKEVLGFDRDLLFPNNLNRFRSHRVNRSFTAPNTIDWRSFTTRVKNQGECGACWAFSTTGSIEAHNAIKTGKLVSLSEQNLMDCSAPFGNNACNGGYMNNAFSYILQNGAINSESIYPYEGKLGKCRFNRNDPNKISIKSFVKITQNSEQELEEALATQGPVSVAIDASPRSLMFYSSGIYFDSGCKSSFDGLNHAVLLVGYGEEGGQKYWHVKNSWGSVWGDQGYIKMAKFRSNLCGIATAASYPVL